MNAAGQYQAFAVAAPGLEPIVAKELVDLGHSGLNAIDGGVEFNANRRQLYEANLHLRTASRVVIRLGRFRALTFAELEKRAGKIPWEQVIASGQGVALRVTCRKSKLYHSGAVAERIERAIVERCHANVSPVSPDEDLADPRSAGSQLIVVRFDHNHCTVSADSSGALLHLRGYRASITRAPVRETLAAALLLASGWDRKSPLLDPFCGSGTIPVEAALLACRIAPGRQRQFQFMKWPGFNSSEWQRLLESAAKAETEAAPVIRGSDRTTAAIRAATENAERAGVPARIRFKQADALKLDPEGASGWIVSNPPYGVRLGSADESQRLITAFADRLRAEFGGWRLAMLAPADVAPVRGLDLKPLTRTTNGGLSVRILVGSVPSTAIRSMGSDPIDPEATK